MQWTLWRHSPKRRCRLGKQTPPFINGEDAGSLNSHRFNLDVPFLFLKSPVHRILPASSFGIRKLHVRMGTPIRASLGTKESAGSNPGFPSRIRRSPLSYSLSEPLLAQLRPALLSEHPIGRSPGPELPDTLGFSPPGWLKVLQKSLPMPCSVLIPDFKTVQGPCRQVDRAPEHLSPRPAKTASP
ncbi:MAG: hypothetical protein ACI9X4_002474 [Glaciecola sp.]